ncbi:ABC transporter substrate-binding protein [Herbiconiux liukaitaii]|uniref:ABC transporter substrate-binding protein n=1 Tax=Herbiconiux liukaitaii TaxID=3342799 RepID=UPI0035B9BC88
MAIRTKWIAAAVAVGMALTFTACSPTPTADTGDKNVPLTFWGSTMGQQAQVDLWNKENPNSPVTYVEQGGDADITQAIQNAVAAGNAPDLFQMPRGQSVSFLVEGVTQDISKWFNNDDSAFAEGAFDFVHVGDIATGVPYGTNPTFNAVNATTFAQFGLSAPTNWDEAVEQAKTMNAQGVKSFNFPGEDPSYLRDWATQAGAEWWESEGDSWKVGFTSPESLEAGQLVQTVIDNDLAANYTYIEFDALMQFFSSGKLSQFTTSTWQLPVYEQNFATSIGEWELASYPTWSESSDLVSPSYYNAYGVTSTTEHPEEATKFARWLSTDPDAVKLLADTVDGSATFPVVADPSGYIEALLPENLLGDTKSAAPEVIENAVETSRSMKDGPNQGPALEELASWWAKALTKEVTVQQVLAHMQEWTVADLKSKNISVSE